jgi:hypothetical protein
MLVLHWKRKHRIGFQDVPSIGKCSTAVSADRTFPRMDLELTTNDLWSVIKRLPALTCALSNIWFPMHPL